MSIPRVLISIFLLILTGPIRRGRALEGVLKKKTLPVSADTLTEQWQGLWKLYGNLAGYKNVEVFTSETTSYLRPYTATDFTNLKTHMSLHVSCEEFAKVLNKYLSDRGPCLRVICARTSSDPCEIAAGTDIEPLFK